MLGSFILTFRETTRFRRSVVLGSFFLAFGLTKYKDQQQQHNVTQIDNFNQQRHQETTNTKNMFFSYQPHDSVFEALRDFGNHETGKARRIGFQVNELINYLALHAPEMLGHARRIEKEFKHPGNRMKRQLRKLIGEKHWRRYLDYYSHLFDTGERIKIQDQAKKQTTTAILPYPTISKTLNNDVHSIIFSFLDDKSMYEASKVSRAFRDALIPRQRNVSLAGFTSIEAFQRMNFVGVEYLSCTGCKWLTDEALASIAGDYNAYPSLARLSIRGCRTLDDVHELEIVYAMGPRLERLIGTLLNHDE